ncbi:MAG TPA: c-type cytochrome [Thermodesulfobacteriota bacterium]|nr:c-type cytochrome [Thermodesulfobacteriota bacterium]
MSRVIFLSVRTFLILLCMIISSYKEIQAQNKDTTQLSGKELFIQYRCVRCHTIGRGRFVGPDLEGVSSRYSKDDIKKWIENPQEIYQSKGKTPLNEGYPPMPPLNIPPKEAELIAQYLLTVRTSPLSKEGGVIRGKVVNNSTEKPAKELEVILTAYLGDKATEEKKVRTNTDGIFEFKNLPWDRSYSISLRYEGGEYLTDKLVFYPDEDTKSLDLPIYEPTDIDKDITVDISHVIVQTSENSLSVAELTVFNNGGKRTYIGAKEIKDDMRETLRFSLPPGASNIELINGLNSESVVPTNNGFVDTSSVLPGIKRVVYAYTLPYKSGREIILKTVDYQTDSFVLLISDSGVKVKVQGLTGSETVKIPDQGRFLQWSGTKIPSGTKIRVDIGESRLLGKDSLKFITFGVLAILVGIGVLYSYVMKSRGKSKTKNISLPTASGIVVRKDLEEERRLLIHEIAKLDDSYGAKEITEEEYMKMRLKKKQRLVEITRKIKKE